MSNNEYWNFIKHIWAEPADVARRLVLADWLAERGRTRQENYQRHAAYVIGRADLIYSIPGFNQVFGAWQPTWCRSKREARPPSGRAAMTGLHFAPGPGQVRHQWFQLHRDGRLVFSPKGMSHRRWSNHVDMSRTRRAIHILKLRPSRIELHPGVKEAIKIGGQSWKIVEEEIDAEFLRQLESLT